MDAWSQENTSRVDRGCLVAEEMNPQASTSERVLLWLLQHPFQSIEDIALALGWHRASVYRGITKLEKQGMVEAVHDPLSSTKARALYLLSSTGITTVAGLLGTDVNTVMAYWRYQERDILEWLPRLSLQRVLQQVINSFVMRWERTNGPGIRTTWKWISDYRPTFIPIVVRQKRIADALVIFSEPQLVSTPFMQSQEGAQSLLLLVDPGFAGERDRDLIRQRVENLRLFYEMLERFQLDRRDPPFFIVTSSKRNREIWRHLLNEPVEGQVACSFSGAIATYGYDEPLPARTAPPWKQISDGRSCDPMQLFSPSTRQELPPALLLPHPTEYPSGTDAKTVLRGHFMQRAQRDNGSGCSEREAVRLLGLCLHRRHLEVLQMVYQHPLLSREELAEALSLEDDSVRHTLSELVRWGCVNIYRLPCGQRFSLGPRGIRFMAALLQVPPAMIAEMYQGHDQRILQHGRRVQRSLIAQMKQLL